MRFTLLLSLCFLTNFLLAQNQTRALIIGISDYRDSLIGDLRFANKDAEIFANYLQSEEGGNLPNSNILRMTNQEATLGAIDNALDWLIKETQKGDKVIIYFSGHGDVEKRTLWQRGYLLAHDTPANNYRNNAIRVEELDEIIKTLSVGNEAKVIVILDACRSGKLATAGPSLTAEQLEKQVENEVRILSCKPDQKSLEGEMWGNGRGLFSFYLVNGLKGLADKGSFPDNVVTFDELRGYIKTNMDKALSDPAISARQNPVFVGDESFELAEVQPKMLEEATHEMDLAMVSHSASTGGKGVVEKSPGAANANKGDALVSFTQSLDLAKLAEDPGFNIAVKTADTAVLLRFFTKRIKNSGSTGEPEEAQLAAQSAFLATVERSENDAPLRQRIQQLLAARLHDQAQAVINDYLRGDAKELDKRQYIDQAEKYVKYPLMLKAAMQLLPKDFLLYHNAEVKYYYFDGVCTRLASLMSGDPMSRIPEAFAKQKKALALDDKAAYIHNELGLLHLLREQPDSALLYFQNAAELAPNWALSQANLCAAYGEIGQLAKAKEAGEKAISLQPDYFGTYVNLGAVAEKEHDLLKAETQYRKARERNDPHYLPYERRAYLQLESARYEEANWQFYEMELRKQGMISPPITTVVVAAPEFYLDPEFEYPSLSGPGVVHKKPKTAQEFFMTGKAYFEMSRFEEATPFFKQAMRLEPGHLEVYYYLGKICFDQHLYEEAEVYFKRLIMLRPEVEFMPFFLANVYRDWQRPAEEEAIYQHFITKSNENDILAMSYLSLGKLMHKQARYSEEELLLWEFFDKMDKDQGIYELSMFYYRMTEIYPNDPNWQYRKADFKYHFDKHVNGVYEFQVVLEKDSLFPARPYIHALAGAYYLNEGDKKYLNEADELWAGDLPKAIAHLRQAAALAPSLPSAKYDLARACISLFKYEEAMAVLENLRDSNDLDFDSRLRLADLYASAGRFEEAKALLDKAWGTKPEAVDGLPALAGKLEMLQGNTAKAIDYYRQEFDLAKASADHSEIAISTAYTLARLYALLDKKADSLKWLEEAFGRGFDSKLVVKYDANWDQYRADLDFEALVGKYSMK